jgi:Bromodomain
MDSINAIAQQGANSVLSSSSQEDVAQTVTPVTVRTASRTMEESVLPPPSSTAVDGKGMWRSWTRVFSKPESACLDLLDNCFDAALKHGFHGKVAMQSHDSLIISIQNNSQTPVKRLQDAMTVYKSSKNAHDDDEKDTIGENGVGLKQGCAALSDCSLVLTRNLATVEIGIIAKDLQSTHGVFLPSFTFDDVRDPSELSDIIRTWLECQPAISAALSNALGPSVDVHRHVTQFAESLYQDQWRDEDHVFLLVLCKLKKSADAPHALIQRISPAKAFLQDIKAMLPEYYINLPSSQGTFDFVIDKKAVDFTHWQKRLVELTKFEVYIPTDRPFESLPEDSWDKPSPDKHTLSIYCGFDAQRVNRDMQQKRGASTCMLYIYSCQAGRLIQKEVDARYMLGLSSSGVDYTQGLTVIVNDVAGKLPLTPTKDGIAWSERTNGDIHQRNLLSWTGAVAGFFWNFHKQQIGGKNNNKVKEVMKNTIQSFALVEQASNGVLTNVPETLEDANLSRFHGVQWKRVQANFDNRWKIRKGMQPCTHEKGPDTLFSITADRLNRIREGEHIKRKEPPTSSREAPPRKQARLVASDSSVVNVGEDGWPEVPQSDMERVVKGVLAYLRAKDRENLFEIPVVEALPTIKDDYLKHISQPMDFRTIETKRSPSYKSIKELQADLILTFQNCILYNGKSSRYGKLALNMLDVMDDAYEATDIKQVTSGVLTYLRDLDEKELFEAPVLEQLPGVKDAYLQVVSQPMDFRTIEEERVKNYTSIEDLRKDLELIFNNCIKFNGAMSMYGVIAQEMLNHIDNAFEDTTLGKRRRQKNKISYSEKTLHIVGKESVATKKTPTSKKKACKVSTKKKPAQTQVRDATSQGQGRERHLLEKIQKLENERVDSLMRIESLKREIADRDDRLWRRALPPIHAGDNERAMLKRILDLQSAKADVERKNRELMRKLEDREQCIMQLKRTPAKTRKEQFNGILKENSSFILFYSEEKPPDHAEDTDEEKNEPPSKKVAEVAPLNEDAEVACPVERQSVAGAEPDILHEPRGWDQMLRLPGTNKMSEAEKLRARQFVEERYNPTPNQKTYKMKIHEAYEYDADTGRKRCKRSFYLELDYRNFTHKLTKKIKAY